MASASTAASAPALAQARARAPIGVAALVLLSIATSVFVFAAAINGPWEESEFLKMMGPVNTRRFCGRGPDAGKWASVLGSLGAGTAPQRAWDACADFFWVIVVVFRNGLRTVLARGAVLLLAVAAGPVVASMFVDALRDSSSALPLVLFATSVLSLGQLITIGSALTLAYVPCHAYRRIAQVRTDAEAVYPPPPPAARAVSWLRLSLFAASSVTFATTFVNVLRDEWVLTNVLFQLYPLVFLPLVLWPYLRKRAGNLGPYAYVTNTTPTDDGSVIVHANRQAAGLYQGMSFILLAGYWFSLTLLYIPGKTLFSALVGSWRHVLNVPLLVSDTRSYLVSVHTIVKNGGVVNDMEWLLFFDTLGVVTAQYLIVLIDAWVDEWQVSLQRKKGRRTHAARFVAEDLFVGLPAIALFGPGWAFARYLQRRETAAEKARFQLLSGASKEE